MWIDQGKQVGRTISAGDDDPTWFSAAIQKWQGQYAAHVSEIRESNMVAEEYDREITIAQPTLEEAERFIEVNSPIEFSTLAPCKGQKIFNPNFCTMPVEFSDPK